MKSLEKALWGRWKRGWNLKVEFVKFSWEENMERHERIKVGQEKRKVARTWSVLQGGSDRREG